MTGKSSNTLNDRVTKLEVEVKSIKEDLKDFEGIKETSIKQTTQFEYIVKSLNEIKVTVDELKSKPSKYWEILITVVITAIGTAFVTHFLGF